MRRIIGVCIAMVALTAVVAADDVFLLRPIGGSEASGLWGRYMGLPMEVAALHSPLRFAKAAGELVFERDVTMAYSSEELGVLARSAGSELVRYAVTFPDRPALPKPGRRYTVRVTVATLEAAGASSPGDWALRKALSGCRWKSGLAWVESIRFDGKGTFTVVVAVKPD